jgi:hypothetical protein
MRIKLSHDRVLLLLCLAYHSGIHYPTVVVVDTRAHHTRTFCAVKVEILLVEDCTRNGLRTFPVGVYSGQVLPFNVRENPNNFSEACKSHL